MTIVYNSKAGHTRRYAEMLSRAEKLKIYSLDEARDVLPRGEEVLFFGWLMAWHISGIDQAVRRFAVKAACGVGMSLPGEAVLSGMKKANYLPDGPLFYLQGGWDPKAVGWIQRRMVAMATRPARLELEKKPERTIGEEMFLIMLREGADFVEYQNLRPLQNWLAARE